LAKHTPAFQKNLISPFSGQKRLFYSEDEGNRLLRNAVSRLNMAIHCRKLQQLVSPSFQIQLASNYMPEEALRGPGG
jgi:hypothetical protein